jgi:hypothetical protein
MVCTLVKSVGNLSILGRLEVDKLKFREEHKK